MRTPPRQFARSLPQTKERNRLDQARFLPLPRPDPDRLACARPYLLKGDGGTGPVPFIHGEGGTGPVPFAVSTGVTRFAEAMLRSPIAPASTSITTTTTVNHLLICPPSGQLGGGQYRWLRSPFGTYFGGLCLNGKHRRLRPRQRAFCPPAGPADSDFLWQGSGPDRRGQRYDSTTRTTLPSGATRQAPAYARMEGFS